MIESRFRPARRTGCFLARDGDSFVIRSDHNQIFRCNETGAVIWELVDGQRTIQEIVDLLDPVYGSQSADLEKETIDFVKRFVEIGLIEAYRPYPREVLLQLKWFGRFGNRMFTYAFGCHYARKFGVSYWMPSLWEGSRLFKVPNDINVCVVPDTPLRSELAQKGPDEDALSERLAAVADFGERTEHEIQYVNIGDRASYGKKDVCFENLCMYTEWLFSEYSREELKSYFQFNEEVVSSDLYRYYESRKGTYAVAHLRRDDIAREDFGGAHSVIDISSYFKAFERYGIDPASVEWISDSTADNLISPHRSDGRHWSFPEGEPFRPGIFFEFFPDFLKLYFAGTIFRANSAFSWWGACLSDAKVYSPVLSARKKFARDGAMECEFVEGNHPHFMGSRSEGFCDILLAGGSS